MSQHPSIKRQARRGGGQPLASALYLCFCFLNPFLSAPLSLAWSLTLGGPLRPGGRSR